MDLLLGIDLGTTGCKSALYDTSGVQRSAGYREYGTVSARGGWAEQNPDDWWVAVQGSAEDCLARLTGGAPSVLGVAVSCANAIVPVDRRGNALYNAIMQVDARAQEQARQCCERYPEEELLRLTGNPVRTGGYSPSVILWIRENLPDIYRDTYRFLAPGGYIVQKLTGAFTIDYSRASTAGLMDIRRLEWSEDICAALGVDVEKLPRLLSAETAAGELLPEAAKALRLPPGTPVSAGAMDSAASVIGAGCCEAGKANHVIGTVSRLCVPMREPVFRQEFLNAYLHREVPYFVMAPSNGGGSSLKWFAQAFGECERAVAESTGVTPYELFDLKAAQVPAGSEGLIYLPYLLGERSPIWDPNARGVFFGITPKHTKSHFLRSIMEGVGYAALQNMRLMEQRLGICPDEIVITGGGARSALWCEILASMTGKCFLRPSQTECETKGAAFIAGLTAGVYRSFRDAERLAEIQSEIRPDPAAFGAYASLFGLFDSLYWHLREDYRELARIMYMLEKKSI